MNFNAILVPVIPALVATTLLSWSNVGAAQQPGAPDEIQTINQLWRGFDPRHDPLEIEVIRSEEEDEGRIRIDWLYFTGQTWDGKKTRVFAYRGMPKSGKKLPGIVHIHGGGQTAHLSWPRYWAKRGYACVSFDFCGDTNTPALGPGYRREHFTRWGGINANMMEIGGGRQMDPGPRHNPWHHWVRIARRALTLLETDLQVDPERLGIFGISVGGTLTWMVAGLDERVRAAVPIYGNGWESHPVIPDEPQPEPDRATRLWRTLIAPEAHAPSIKCPILFLDATNDGHGRIDMTKRTLDLTGSTVKRHLYTPGYDHHIEPEEARSMPLWMNLHLKSEGSDWPQTPLLDVCDESIPQVAVRPDRIEAIERVDLFYCLNNRIPMSRFWQKTNVTFSDGATWKGPTPYLSDGDVIFTFANVLYRSGRKVSSDLVEFKTANLPAARPSLMRELLISRMDDTADWYFVPAYTDPNLDLGYFQSWTGAGETGFTFNDQIFGRGSANFHFATHKPGASPWRGTGRRGFAIDILTASLPTRLEVRVVEENRQVTYHEYSHVAILTPAAGLWTTLELTPEDFADSTGKKLGGWDKVDFLALIGIGAEQGHPVFKRLRWLEN